MFKKLVPARRTSHLFLALVVAISCIALVFYIYAVARQQGGIFYTNASAEKTLAKYALRADDAVLGKIKEKHVGYAVVSVLSKKTTSYSGVVTEMLPAPAGPAVRVGAHSVELPQSPASAETSTQLAANPSAPAVEAQAAANERFQLDSTVLLTEGTVLQPVGTDTFGRVGKVLYADLHKVAQFLGYKVKLYEESGFYAVYRENERASVFVIDSNFAHIHGVDVTTDGPLVRHEDKVYAPFSAILKLEKLAYLEDADGDIVMSKEHFERFSKLFSLYRTTPVELKNFARLLFFEARDGTIIKKLAVASVVMNRVYSPRFQSTIHDVIFAHNQFPPAYYASFPTLEPEPIYYEAARRVLNGENTVPNVFFFNLAPFPGKEADFYKNIEGDYFYY